jgi:hypothetical protein
MAAHGLCVVCGQSLADVGPHIDEARLIYHIAKRGEFVEFGLPHHCHGGEKYWVSRNGKTKVLINVD